MKCLLRSLLAVAVIFYMAMIYASAPLASLGFATVVFLVVSFGVLIPIVKKAKPVMDIPLSLAEQEQKVRVCLENKGDGRLKPGRVRYQLVVQNPITGKKHKKWFPADADYIYTVMNPGKYEFRLAKVRVYDWSGLIWWEKKINQLQYVQVNPTIYACQIKPSESVRSFMGESDIYDDFRPGYDPQELFAVREFQNGDKLQRVHWKLSAKHEDLMVKENGMPKACAVTILANPGYGKEEQEISKNPVIKFYRKYLKRKSRAKERVAFLQSVVGISFTLMDLKLPHYVAWYSNERKSIVRARVDDEEGFYEFLNYFLEEALNERINARPLYNERFRSERLLHLIELDRDLCVHKNGKRVGRLHVDKLEKEMEQLEIDL